MRTSQERREAVADGVRAERAVARLFRARGWDVLAERWRGGGGEIDLVIELDGRLRFVEVKLRAADDPVGLECVTDRKLSRIRSAAESFLQGYAGEVNEACLLVALGEHRDGQLHLQLYDDPG